MNKQELLQLLNTLKLIETKGDNTLIMADCIKFVSQKIREYEEEKSSQD